jgi:hypothetical protein
VPFGVYVDMPDYEDQAFRRRFCFGASGPSPVSYCLRRGGGNTVEKDCQFGCLNFS